MEGLFAPIPYLVMMPKVFIILVIVVSAAFGSFFTMLYYRLPIMFQSWHEGKSPSVNLCFPASHCPSCKTPLRFWHNIPLLSYLFSNGKCAFCAAKIPLQYFIMESLLVIFGLVITLYFKVIWATVVGIVAFWAFLALFAVLVSIMSVRKKEQNVTNSTPGSS